MKRLCFGMISLAAGFCATQGAWSAEAGRAPFPPMGWNVSGSYGIGRVTEAAIKRGVDAMIASGLRKAGYNIVLIDYGWYLPSADLRSLMRSKFPLDYCDKYGRLIPYPKRYPSSMNGRGFKPLADYLHSKGMKLGLHIMRGIYRGAYNANLPIKGTSYHARDIAATRSTCSWSTLMYGLNMTHPGAQAYLDSLMEQYGEWGVDFLKIDDLISPYHGAEIAGYDQARAKAGRPIIISGSPGNHTPLKYADDLRRHMEMFRVTKDQWDNWRDILVQFKRAAQWARYGGRGAWVDLDALPFGRIFDMVDTQKPISCRLTHEEVLTSMTLHCIVRSPLVFYADPLRLDDFTRSVLTNPDALDACRHGANPRQIYGDSLARKWVSRRSEGGTVYLALFNLTREPRTIEQSLADVGLGKGVHRVRDIWGGKEVETGATVLSPAVPAHGVVFYRIDKEASRP